MIYIPSTHQKVINPWIHLICQNENTKLINKIIKYITTRTYFIIEQDS